MGSHEYFGKIIVTLILCGVYLFHFSVTVLFNLQQNVFTNRYAQFVNLYMRPLFTQNWNFFAPNPPTRDDYLLVRYKMRSKTGLVEVGPWINVSLSFDREVQRNRFSALEIVQLVTSNTLNDVAPAIPRYALRNRRFEQLVSVEEFPIEIQVLYRDAMAFAAYSGGNVAPTGVQIAILHHFYPRFAQRMNTDNLANGNTVSYLPWVRAEAVPSFAEKAYNGNER